jgi:hypothetical protein
MAAHGSKIHLCPRLFMTDHHNGNLYELPLDGISTRRKIARARGRPRWVAKRPLYDQNERQQWLKEQLTAHVDDDAVVRAVRGSAGARELIDVLSEELARECAALEWERAKRAPGTRACERASSRRVRALVDLARLQFLRRQLADDDLDPRNPQVQRVVGLLVDRITSVAQAVLPPASAAALATAWRQALTGWEDEVDS